MANEERLIVSLDARTNEFRNQMRTASSEVRNLGQNSQNTQRELIRLSSVSQGVGKAIGGMASIAKNGALIIGGLTTAMFAAAAGASSYAKEIQIASQLSGESVEGIQSLAFATNTVGIGLEQIGDISKDVREKIGDLANTGGGGFQDFADAMGYSKKQAMDFANALKGSDATTVLQTIVNTMEGAGISAEQMSHALEGLGSEATRLIPLLTDGGKAMKELRTDFNETAVVLTDTDISKLGELGTQFSSLYDTFKGTVGKISVAYAEELSTMAKNTQEGLKFISDEFESGAFATRFNAFLNAFTDSWTVAIGENETEFNEFGKDFSEIIKALHKMWVEFIVTMPVSLKIGLKTVQSMFFDAFTEIGFYIDTALAGLKLVNADIDGFVKAMDSAREKRNAIMDENPYDAEIESLREAKQAIIDKFNEEQALADKQHEDFVQKSKDRLQVLADEQEEKQLILSQKLEDIGPGGESTGEAGVTADPESDKSPEVIAEETKNKELAKLSRERLKSIGVDTKNLEKFEKLQTAIIEKSGKDQISAALSFFDDNKAIKAGMIISDTASAAMQSFEAAGGYPFGVVPAALSVAFGAQQLAALKSSSSSGGGSIAAGGGAGAAATPDFVPETTSLDVTEGSSTGTQTIRVELATESGDELAVALGRSINNAKQTGRLD